MNDKSYIQERKWNLRMLDSLVIQKKMLVLAVVLLECGNVKKLIYIVNCADILSHFSHIINRS